VSLELPVSDGGLTRARAGRLRVKLLDWYDAACRDLPWRRSRDPYAIWISETMLQQTRVDTVIPYYERFLDHFPDLQALADADEDSVYSLWAGLGYYSRARNLRAAARKVVDEFGGRLPEEAEELRSLPGIGRYTAGAIASIAFDRPEAIVDGNVARVLCRLLGIRESISTSSVTSRLWREAASLARGPRPGALNQALMELGAVICTPTGPDCPSCPVRRTCAARRAGDAEELPRKSPKTPARNVRAVALWLERSGRALAVRREPGGLLGGLWELPGEDLGEDESLAGALERLLAQRLGVAARQLRSAGSVKHIFSHRRLTLHIYRAQAARGRIRCSGFAQHRWLSAAGFRELPSATLTRKALRLLDLSTEPEPAHRPATSRAR
jgi:A/G-specific adenine glycosylase